MLMIKDNQVIDIVKEVMNKKWKAIVPKSCSFETIEEFFSSTGITYKAVYTGLDLNRILAEINNKDCEDKWYALVDNDSCFEEHELLIVSKIKDACELKGIVLICNQY